jgi:MFS family permease
MAQLLGVAMLVGLATVLFDVANSTFIVTVVAPEQLTARNSLVSATSAVTQTGGPSLGGALVSLVGAAGAVLFDVGSYLASSVLLSQLPSARARGRVDAAPVWEQVRDGLRFVVRHPVIGPCAAMATCTNFVCGALLALGPVYLVRTLHAPVGLVGVLMACEGVGTLAGAAATTAMAQRLGSARLLIRATAAGGLMSLLIPLAGSGARLALFAVGNAGFAAGVVVLSILARTHRQAASPPDLLPRVMATVRFISWGVVPIGAVLAGGLAGLLGLRTALGVFCLVSLAVPAVGLWSRVGRLRDLADG